MTTPFSSSLQDLSVCLNHPQIVSWQPKIRCRILETFNSWMTNIPKLDAAYSKHPTNGWPKNVPKMKTGYTTSIQLMDMTNMMTNQNTQNRGRATETSNLWMTDIYKRTRRSTVQLHECLELGSVEWIVQLNDLQLQTCTWSLQKIAPKTKKRFCQSSLNFLKMRNNLLVGNYSCRVQTLLSVYASC
jgi:hypothetical protein